MLGGGEGQVVVGHRKRTSAASIPEGSVPTKSVWCGTGNTVFSAVEVATLRQRRPCGYILVYSEWYCPPSVTHTYTTSLRNEYCNSQSQETERHREMCLRVRLRTRNSRCGRSSVEYRPTVPKFWSNFTNRQSYTVQGGTKIINAKGNRHHIGKKTACFSLFIIYF